MLEKLSRAGFPVIFSILFLALSFFGYAGLAWWVEREDYQNLTLFFVCCFSGYAIWWFNRSFLSWRTILVFAVIFRALFLFDDTCRLSDDVYRFIWDAEQLAVGQNPYEWTPRQWAVQNPNTIFDEHDDLYSSLNSKEYYSVYPPVCQMVWSNSAWIAKLAGVGNSLGHRIIFLKIIYFIIEITTLLLLVNILLKRGQAGQLAGIYALNPLIITEFTGNLHPEAMMILLLVMASLLAFSKRPLLASIPFGFAISTKFIPLLFVPFLAKQYGWKKTLLFGSLSVGVAALLFVPFVTGNLIHNISSSLSLYYNMFEFNGSVYFVIRNLIEGITGYNYIVYIGPALALLLLVIVGYLYFKQKTTLSTCLMVYFFYLLSSTTVHPWYMSLPVVIAVFTTRRWPLVASCAVMLSYYLYSFGKENWWIIGIEYTIILGSVIWDAFYQRKQMNLTDPS